jgi:hypothetical protein
VHDAPRECDIPITRRSLAAARIAIKPRYDAANPPFNGPFRPNDEAYRVTRWHRSSLELPCGNAVKRDLQPDISPNENISSQLSSPQPGDRGIANLGIDMPKARLHLIVCSDDIGPEARRRRSGRSFRPSVIDGGKRAIAMPAGNPWQALLELFDLGLLVSRTNYLAFVAASLTVLEHHGWTDFQAEQSGRR